MNKCEKVATALLGWDLLEIDYQMLNRPSDPFYKRENAAEKIAAGKLVVFQPPDWLSELVVTPSVAKWWDLIEREEIHSVGYYYVRPRPIGTRIIERDEFKPFTNAHDDYQVLKRVRQWGSADQRRFISQTGVGILEYQPGNWSRAALAVVRG